MVEDRLAEFSQERLGGRPVPEDLRALAEAQWSGRGHPLARYGITVIEPGAPSMLTDQSYLNEADRADPDIMANSAALVAMAEYLKVVAVHENSDCYGYWLHPHQRTEQPPPIVKVDTECSLWTLAGRTLAEACLGDLAYDDDELFTEMAAGLAELNITIPVDSAEDLDEPTADPDPSDVHTELYSAERVQRGLEPYQRPQWSH